MCRFLCYVGAELPLADLLYRPQHSLILQSYRARERKEPLNGDGFGVGWYTPRLRPDPCVFTSITPAWSNQNLRRLSEHITSPCVFAHVRAASPGMRVCEANCHPFRHGRFLWMHNGTVAGFRELRRGLRASLPDHLYEMIEGTTDSEHAFAIFLDLLGDSGEQYSAAEIGRALVGTVGRLERWSAERGITAPSYYNFAVTDGRSVAAIRYVSEPTLEPASLYYSDGGMYRCEGGACRFVDCRPEERSVVIASERLTDRREDWVRVAPNHLLTVTPGLEVRVGLMEVERRGEKVGMLRDVG